MVVGISRLHGFQEHFRISRLTVINETDETSLTLNDVAQGKMLALDDILGVWAEGALCAVSE